MAEPHVQTKAATHLIEAQNASIRDNLARFNRRSKTFHKLDAPVLQQASHQMQQSNVDSAPQGGGFPLVV